MRMQLGRVENMLVLLLAKTTKGIAVVHAQDIHADADGFLMVSELAIWMKINALPDCGKLSYRCNQITAVGPYRLLKNRSFMHLWIPSTALNISFVLISLMNLWIPSTALNIALCLFMHDKQKSTAKRRNPIQGFSEKTKGAASQAKRVCKSWKTILDERRHDEVGFLFAYHDDKDNKIQLYFGEEYDHIDDEKMNYYYSRDTLMEMEHCRFSFESVQSDILVGSCNGLVCFQKEDTHVEMPEPFAICNPLTGEFIILEANSSLAGRDENDLIASGFGYCHSTKEYKVVRLYTSGKSYNEKLRYGSYVQVYTIGSNQWRDMETFVQHTFCESGIFANGVLHWLEDDGIDGSAIAAFDLEDEKFRELPLPPPEVVEHGDSNPWNRLKLLGGNLCWVKRICTHIDIWAYKKKNVDTSNAGYGMEEHDQKLDYYSETSWGWVKEFDIECGRRCEPFAITKSNQVLLSDESDLYCFDPKTRTMSKLGDDNGMGGLLIHAIPHANSYVSLKDFGETWYGPGCSAAPQILMYLG